MATVLIVDDDAALREGLAETVGDLGHRPVVAASGIEALARLAAGGVNAVLLDLRMPGDLDGMATLARIRAQAEPPPVLVLTAQDAVDFKVQALRSGADDYVTKPFAFEELLARVEALGRRPKEIRDPVLRVGDLELDTATREVRRAGTPIELTP